MTAAQAPALPGTGDAAPARPPRCCADWGEGKRCQHCTLPQGHDGNHIDGIGHAWAGCPGHAAPFTPPGAAA